MVYLSLGSNVGDRFSFLEKATKQIQEKIGWIRHLSPVYETPAWGYAGASFLNACIGVDTQISPENVLNLLLKIEVSLGRERNNNVGYQDRCIDLDILLYDDLILEDSSLQLPHPRMELRQFILTPMVDIAAEVVHPKLQKNMRSLKEECRDTAELRLWKASLNFPEQ